IFRYSEDIGPTDYPEIAQRLCDLGAKNVVLTSVYKDENKRDEETGYYVYSEGADPYYHMHEKEDTWFKGVGDISVRLITAYYLLGDSVQDAVIKRSDYIEQALRHSLTVDRDKILGIYFEPLIPELSREIDEMRKQK